MMKMMKIAVLFAVFVSLMLVAPCFASLPPVTHGLVGCWNFDEGSGVTADDSSGNGNHGLIVNATYTGDDIPPQELSGYSLVFNNGGGNAYSYATIPDNSSLRPSSGLTLAAWVKAGNYEGRERVIVSKQWGGSTSDSYVLWYHSDGNLWFDVGGVGHILTVQPPANEWHHIVGTFNGSFMRLYVDGVEKVNSTATGSIPYDANPVLIGADSNQADHTPDSGWNGTIDNVLVYNRALSGPEIQAIRGPIEISPRGTYLHADPGQGSYADIPVDPPAIIDLQSYGLFEGDTVLISFNGSVKRGPSYDASPVTALLGVFSSTNEVLPINETHRVPGAIEAGEDIITVQTWYSHEDTDIPEDFAITPATGFSIEIPQNATYLFICYHDSYYPDNTAPEPVTVTIARADVQAPDVDIPITNPARDNVQPSQNVTVSVNVTDTESGVKNVTLSYSLDNGTTWEDPQSMDLNATNGLYEGTIPGQPIGTEVRFKIVAFDNAENNVTMDGTSLDYMYTVVPEFSTLIVIPLFMIATLLAVTVYRKKHFA